MCVVLNSTRLDQELGLEKKRLGPAVKSLECHPKALCLSSQTMWKSADWHNGESEGEAFIHLPFRTITAAAVQGTWSSRRARGREEPGATAQKRSDKNRTRGSTHREERTNSRANLVTGLV